MPSSPTGKHSAVLAELYRTNPELFTPEDVRYLVERSEADGVPVSPEAHENYLTEVPKQLLGGFIQGFSTFIDPFDEPQGIAGRIAKSVGGVFGFVGSFFGMGKVTQLAGKALTRAGGTKVAATLARGASLASEEAKLGATLIRTGKLLERTPLTSVPMGAANLATQGLSKIKAYTSAMEALRKTHPVLEQAAKGAIHLGIASGVSGIPGGVGSAIHSTLFGAFAGGAFAGIGNIPGFTQNTTFHNLAKSMAGGIINGLPSTLEGQTTPEQVYHYLLGAYFGYHSPTWQTQRAYETFATIPESRRQWALTSPEAAGLEPEVRKALNTIVTKTYNQTEVGKGLAELFSVYPGMRKTGAEFEAESLAKPDTTIYSRKNPELSGTVTSIDQENRQYYIRDAKDNTDKTISFDDTVTTNPKYEGQIVDTVEIPELHEFDGVQSPITPQVARFVEKLMGRRIGLTDYLNHVNNINATLDKIVLEARQTNPYDQPSEIIGKAYTKFRSYLEGISKAANKGQGLKEEDYADIEQYFNRQVQGHTVPLVGLDKGAIFEYPSLNDGRSVVDPDLSRMDPRKPLLEMQALTKDPNAVTIFDSFVSQRPGMSRKRTTSQVSFPEVDGYPAERDPDAVFRDANLREGVDMREMYRAIKDFRNGDMYLYSGVGEKAQFLLAKHLADKNPEPEFQQIMDQLTPLYKSRDAVLKDFTKHQDYMVQRGLVDALEYKRQVVSNIKWLQLQNPGISLETMFKNPKGFITNALDFNKRMPIMMTDMYALAPHHVGKDLRGKQIDRLNYLLFEDPVDLGKKFGDELLGKEVSDGGVIVPDWLLERILRGNGLPSQGGFGKTLFINRDDALGMMLGKMALHAAGPELSKAMDARGLHFLVPRSAAKQSGLRTFHDIDWDPTTKDLVIKRMDGKAEPETIHSMPISDVKISYGVFDPAKSSPMTRMAKQLMSQMTYEQAGPAAQAAMEKMMLDQYEGTPEANEAMAVYLAKPTEVGLKKLISWEKDGTLKEGSLIEEMGINQMFDAMRQSPKFRGQALAYILRNSTEHMKQQEIDLVSDTGDDATAIQRLRGALDMIKLYPGEGVSDALVMAKHLREPFQRVISDFVTTRMASPMLRNGFKAFMRAYDPELRSRLKLTKDIFYLDDGLRGVKINGITRDGLNKRMSIAEQYLLYTEVRNALGKTDVASAQKKSLKALAKKMEQSMQSVVLRVPMDDMAGAQSLRFAGFTGRKGTGILLHADNMKKLGGADLDIDSAFGYFGIDPAIHSALVKNSNAHTDYATAYPMADEVFKKTATDLRSRDDQTALTMFDPYHRMRYGKLVGDGRNELLGRAVANRFLMHTLFSTLNQMPLNGKSSGNTKGYVDLDLETRPGHKLRLYVRSDDGLMLRTFAGRIINMAADVGKVGGLISPPEMRAVLLHAAFPRIEYIRPGKKAGEAPTIIDITGDTELHGELNYTGQRRVLSRAMEQLGGTGIYKVRLFKNIQNLNQTLWGYNHREGRPYSEAEIRDAARNFPSDIVPHPVRRIAEQLQVGKFTTDNLEHFLSGNGLANFADQVSQFNEVIKDLQKSGAYAFLRQPTKEGKQGFGVNDAQLVARLAVLREFGSWADSPSRIDISTPDGRLKLAQSETEFAAFFDRFARAKTTHSKETTGKEQLRARIENERKRFFPLWRKDRNGESYSVLDARVRWLTNSTRAANDMLATRIQVLRDLPILAKYIDRSGIMAYDTPDNRRGLGVVKEVMANVGHLKSNYDYYFKQRSESGKFNETIASYDKLLAAWAQSKQNIFDWVQAQNRAGRPMDWEAVSDFMDAAMFASLTPGTKTHHGRFGQELVPARIIHDFNEAYDTAFRMVSRPKEKGQTLEITEFLSGRAEAEKLFRPKSIEEQQAVLQQFIDIEALPSGRAKDPEVRELVGRIHRALSHFDKFTMEDVFKVARDITGLAQPKDWTKFELEGLAEMLESWKRTPGFFRDILKAYDKSGEAGKKGFPVSKRHWLNFMPTTADDLRRSSIRVHYNRLFNKDGTFNRSLRPLIHYNEELQDITKVYAETAEVMSPLHDAIKMMSIATSHASQADALGQHIFDKHTGWVTRGVTSADGKKVSVDKLYQLALRTVESRGAEQYYRDLINKRRHDRLENMYTRPSEKQLERAKRTWEYYEGRLRELTEVSNSFKDKTFIAQVGSKGELKEITGSELRNKLVDDINAARNEFTKTYVQLDPQWAKRHLAVGKEQRSAFRYVDVGGSYRLQDKLWDVSKLEDPSSLENVNLMFHYDSLDRSAREEAARTPKPRFNEAAVRAFKRDPIIEAHADQFPELRAKEMSPEEAKIYLHFYTDALDRYAEQSSTAGLEKEIELAKLSKNYIKGSRAESRVLGMERALNDLQAPEANLEASKESAIALMRYVGRRLPANDIRRVLYGDETFSKMALDLEYARGEITPHRYYFKVFEDQHPFTRLNPIQGYVPHMDIPDKVLDAFKSQKIDEILKRAGDLEALTPEQREAVEREIDTVEKELGELRMMSTMDDAGLSASAAADFLQLPPELEYKSLGKKKGAPNELPRSIRLTKDIEAISTNHMFSRKYNVPGYREDSSIWTRYIQKNSRATYKTLAAFRMRRLLQYMERNNIAGEYTGDWSAFTRIYFRDAMGYPTLLDQDILDSKTLKIRGTPYYWLSDQMVFEKGTTFNKVAIKLLGLDKLSKADIARYEVKTGKKFTEAIRSKLVAEKQAKLLDKRDLANAERVAYQLKNLSRVESQYNLMTLLFATKSGVGNLLGAGTNIAVWNGAAAMRDIFNLERWQEINHEWRTFKDLYKFVAETGVVEDWIIHEGGVDTALKSRFPEFFDAVVKKIKHDPEVADATLLDLAKQYNVPQSMVKLGGFFMHKSERLARINAFLASYMATRNSLAPMQLAWDNPYLIETAKKAIGITQFLYSNDTRPPFSRSSLGHIFARFKLWAWSSVKFQRQVYEEARNRGFRPNTPEFDRFKRLQMANLFAIGLASMLPYSIFENNLPAPFKWLQDLADWLFGDEDERKKAFFAQSTGMPTMLAPLNELLPPIARVPKGIYDIPATFNSMWSGNVNAAGQLTSYTLFPFGRMAKDVLRAINEPSRMVEILTGIPFTGIERATKKEPG